MDESTFQKLLQDVASLVTTNTSSRQMIVKMMSLFALQSGIYH